MELTPEIVQQLIRKFGSQRAVARELGIPRSTLGDQIRKWQKEGRWNEPVSLSEIRQKRLAEAGLDKQVHRLLMREELGADEIAGLLNVPESAVRASLKSLSEAGYDIRHGRYGYRLNRTPEPGRVEELIVRYHGNEWTFGVVADMHAGSKKQQFRSLHEFYDLCVARKVRHVFNAGDLAAGYNIYPGQDFEVFLHGADEQTEYLVKNYPQRDEIITHFIDGNHDLSFFKAVGYDIGKAVSKQRPDMHFLGQYDATVIVDGIRINLVHPDGGTAYALSYKPQKLNEGLGRSEDVPDIMIIGHYHRAEFLPYLGVYQFQAGCFEAQTLLFKRRHVSPALGGWIVTVNIGREGINRIVPEFIPFAEVEQDYELAENS